MISDMLSLSSDPSMRMKPMCNSLGMAGVMVGFAWVFQAFGFNAGPTTEASWIIMGSIIAGTGAGLLLVAHTDVV